MAALVEEIVLFLVCRSAGQPVGLYRMPSGNCSFTIGGQSFNGESVDECLKKGLAWASGQEGQELIDALPQALPEIEVGEMSPEGLAFQEMHQERVQKVADFFSQTITHGEPGGWSADGMASAEARERLLDDAKKFTGIQDLSWTDMLHGAELSREG